MTIIKPWAIFLGCKLLCLVLYWLESAINIYLSSDNFLEIIVTNSKVFENN